MYLEQYMYSLGTYFSKGYLKLWFDMFELLHFTKQRNSRFKMLAYIACLCVCVFESTVKTDHSVQSKNTQSKAIIQSWKNAQLH